MQRISSEHSRVLGSTVGFPRPQIGKEVIVICAVLPASVPPICSLGRSSAISVSGLLNAERLRVIVREIRDMLTCFKVFTSIKLLKQIPRITYGVGEGEGRVYRKKERCVCVEKIVRRGGESKVQ